MIITLIGSGRFEPYFHRWACVLGLAGHMTFGLSAYKSLFRGKKDWFTESEKALLDLLHFQKIEKADAIFLINPFGYIGASTLNEINYARTNSTPIYALQSWARGNGQRDSKNFTVDSRKLALQFDIVSCRSPIDTFSPHMLCPYSSAILDKNGNQRQRQLKIIGKYK